MRRTAGRAPAVRLCAIAEPVCEACGEPATRQDCEGVWLCEGDYQHLLEHDDALRDEVRRQISGEVR